MQQLVLNLAQYMAWDMPESEEKFREVWTACLYKMQAQYELVLS
jgi:hypothetical protein